MDRSPAEILAILGLDASEENLHVINSAGVQPMEWQNSVLDGTYYTSGMTIEALCDEFGAGANEFPRLRKDFKVIVEDFDDDLAEGVPSMALEFAKKFLFEIAPKSKEIKKGQTDKRWLFKYTYKLTPEEIKRNEEASNLRKIEDTKGAKAKKTDSKTEKALKAKVRITNLVVATFKNGMKNFKNDVSKGIMLLTTKQAGILSLCILERTTAYSCAKKQIIFTPLAGAIFSRDDLTEMLEELNKKLPALSKMTLVNLVDAINQSCQSGGQVLDKSQAWIAVAATVGATRNMRREEEQMKIITKTLKDYLNKGKDFNEELFEICSKYAAGGVPAAFAAENLIKIAKRAQQARITATQMKALTESKPVGTIRSKDETAMITKILELTSDDEKILSIVSFSMTAYEDGTVVFKDKKTKETIGLKTALESAEAAYKLVYPDGRPPKPNDQE